MNKKATLEFNLEDVYAAKDFNMAANASNMSIIIGEMFNRLRKWEKYEDRSEVSVDEVRELLCELIDEYYPGFNNDVY